MEQQKRHTAVKAWIGDLLNSTFTSDNSEQFPYFAVRNKKISRVNILATVVTNYQNDSQTFKAINLDDGSGNIRVKTWNEDISLLANIRIGQSVLVVGRPKKSPDGEIFITPEIVREMNPTWVKVRKIELEKEYGLFKREESPQQQTQPNLADQELIQTPDIQIQTPEYTEEEIIESEQEQKEPTETTRQRVLGIISKNDSEKGVNIEILKKESNLPEGELEKVLQDLISEGEIFKLKGKIRLT